MFRREIYRAMERVLDAFEADALERTGFFFAGGTRIALAHDEFRISRDIDFVCSDAAGYADLRAAVHDRGYDAVLDPSRRVGLDLPREIRADQYGLRFPVLVGGMTIRVELLREGRFALGQPEHALWTRVPLLSIPDAFAEKLLANSDRGADPDELSRDLLDLAMLRTSHGPIPAQAWAAAETAYRAVPRALLRTAIDRFLASEAYRERCFARLGVEDGARVLTGVRALLQDLGAGVG